MSKQVTALRNEPFITTEFQKLKLIGDNEWQSPGNLIYGCDKKFGNNFHHVLSHTVPNPAKELHTVFSVSKDKIVELIDEAWALKENPLVSDPVVYIVNMKRAIGTNGETAIRIVVKKAETAEIKTAYPVKL